MLFTFDIQNIYFDIPCSKCNMIVYSQDLSSESVMKILFSYFSTKTYVVGAQKNRLNETVLLSIQNIC